MDQIETSTNKKLGITKHINKYITIEFHSNQKFSMGKNLHMERRTNNHKNNTK